MIMFNPPNLPQPSSYFDLKKRLTQSLQSANVDDRILETVQKLFDQTLISEGVVLARVEKERLLRGIMKSILTDMVAGLDGDR